MAQTATAVHLVTHYEAIVRLLVSVGISSVIGMEREYHHKPAGLRTNVMVGLGATLMTLTSLKVAEVAADPESVDPARIAAQLVSGIGFIGAGAILRPANGTGHIVGLTTAATLWVVCGLGIAVGFGFYVEAIASAILVPFTFLILNKISNKIQGLIAKHSPVLTRDDDDLPLQKPPTRE